MDKGTEMRLDSDQLQRGGAGSPLDFAVDHQQRLTMSTVRRAVERGDAVLAFQPVVQAARTDRAAFHEGLIRIIDETGGFVPLRDFMPLAELSELGRQIDCLSLALGCRRCARNRGCGCRSTCRRARSAIPTGCGPCTTGCRATHRGGTADPGNHRKLGDGDAGPGPPLHARPAAAGVSFALDDFGAGYTSFRYLREFSFDMIKIDGRFIRDIASQPDNQVLTRALMMIARHFDMFTVAEQVETADDAAYLIELGVDCLQGFYFGAPTISPPWRTPNASTRR